MVETGARMAFFPDLENHKGRAKVERLKQLLPDRFRDGILPPSRGESFSHAPLSWSPMLSPSLPPPPPS
jgi:hypothetical protein